MSNNALTYLRVAAEILAMPGGPSRNSARTAIRLARLAADRVEKQLSDNPEINSSELVGCDAHHDR